MACFLIVEPHFERFLAYCDQALEAGAQALAFGNPDWGPLKWAQFPFRPEVILGTGPLPDLSKQPAYRLPTWAGKPPYFWIPTGGTSGKLKLALHNEKSLLSAAQGFWQRFDLRVATTFCVLPLCHIGGFMQVIRVRLQKQLSGHGQLVFPDFKALREGIIPDIKGGHIALVPRQLQLLSTHPKPRAWLKQLDWILVGGGPLDAATAEATQDLPIIQSYGLTEAAASVAIQDGLGFRPLPHINLMINNGCLALQGPSVIQGFYDQPYDGQTQDKAEKAPDGSYLLKGRADRCVSTRGGETVDLDAIHNALLTSGLCLDVDVFLDPEQGVLLTHYLPINPDVSPENLQLYLENTLGKVHSLELRNQVPKPHKW